jgi:hypothetical protein
MDLARQIIANQSHRKTMDPMSFRRWGRPFVIERIDATPDPKSPKLSEER